MLSAHDILHEDWRAIVDSNEDIGSAVIIEISDGQTTRCQRLTENRPAMCAYISETLTVPLKQHGALSIGHL